jgi:sugar O-acyltransferase (sialic acid O-acetyltransferase NeuD family)
VTAIVLVGAGGHAAACIDVIEAEGRFEVAGLIGTAAETGRRVLGYPVLGVDDELPRLVAGRPAALVAVGQIATAEPRIRLFERLERLGCELPVIVSPRAHVSRHARLGAGTIVMHGAIVNAGALVGRNCIINSQALVEHDAVIGDHCHIATAAVINGAVRIGAATFIGSNATVRQGVNVGERCIIGMGELLLTDCASGACMPLAGKRTREDADHR